LNLKRDEDKATIPEAKLSGYILVVDDSDINRIIAQFMLEGFGLTVATAENGQQSLEQFQKHAFDMILMDCEMPIMNGYVASRTIRDMQSGEAPPYYCAYCKCIPRKPKKMRASRHGRLS
jgi:CheY-like chemotaxis protein